MVRPMPLLTAAALLAGSFGSGAGCADAAELPSFSEVPRVPFNERTVVQLPAGRVEVYVEVPEPLPLDDVGIAGGPNTPAAGDVVVASLAEDRRVPLDPPDAVTRYTGETRGGELIGTLDVPSAGRYAVRVPLERPSPGAFVGFDPGA